MTGTVWSRVSYLLSRALLPILVVLSCYRPAAAELTLPPAQEMYAIYGHINFATELYRIDLATSTAVRVGSTGLRHLGALAASPDGTLYSWHGSQGLVTINRATGVASDVNPAIPSQVPEAFGSIDVAPNGNLIGTLQRGSGNEVYEINRTTGAVIAMRAHPLSPGHPPIYGIAFVGDQLVGVNSDPFVSSFFEIDVNSAAITTVGATGKTSLASLAADLHGNLFSMVAYPQAAALDFEVVRLDSTTGVALESKLIHQTTIPFYYRNTGLAVVTVPEPITSSWVLCGGCAALWTLGRRRLELRR